MGFHGFPLGFFWSKPKGYPGASLFGTVRDAWKTGQVSDPDLCRGRAPGKRIQPLRAQSNGFEGKRFGAALKRSQKEPHFLGGPLFLTHTHLAMFF